MYPDESSLLFTGKQGTEAILLRFLMPSLTAEIWKSNDPPSFYEFSVVNINQGASKIFLGARKTVEGVAVQIVFDTLFTPNIYNKITFSGFVDSHSDYKISQMEFLPLDEMILRFSPMGVILWNDIIIKQYSTGALDWSVGLFVNDVSSYQQILRTESSFAVSSTQVHVVWVPDDSDYVQRKMFFLWFDLNVGNLVSQILVIPDAAYVGSAGQTLQIKLFNNKLYIMF